MKHSSIVYNIHYFGAFESVLGPGLAFAVFWQDFRNSLRLTLPEVREWLVQGHQAGFVPSLVP